MKVIFCLNHFLPEHLAGIEVYTLQLVKGLSAMQVKCIVLIPNLGSDVTEEYLYQGVRVMRYAENSLEDRRMILGQTKPAGVEAFVNILKQEQPDVVHFQELAPGRGISLHHVRAVKALHIKILLTCHLSTYSCQTGNLVFKEQQLCDGIIRINKCSECVFYSRGIYGIKAAALQSVSGILYKAGLNTSNWNMSLATAMGFPFIVKKKKDDLLELGLLCDKIISLTHWYKKMLEMNGVPANKITYCAQGLPGNGETFAKKQFGIIPIRLVFLGRISKYKGVHLLLEALQQLPADKIKVDFYGPVTEDDYGRECKAQSIGMSNVHWKGSIPSGEVVGMLKEYDLLCLPSTFSEMSPLVIQEAFAAGIPVLASNVYGNAEQIQDGINGWLFDFRSVASLKQKLLMLIDNPKLIDNASSHIPVARTFTAISKEHLNLYGEILSVTKTVNKTEPKVINE